MKTPKKVIFDMDGLIFDSERIFMRELKAVASDYGYTITYENYIKSLGLTGEALFRLTASLYGADYPHYELSRKARERVDEIALTDGLPVKPGIEELLRYLNQKNISCAVASSTHKQYVEKYLNSAGLQKYFEDIICGDMVEKSKPEPDIFLAAAGSTPPGDALVLEDSANGIIAAARAGIPVICIPDMTEPSDEIRAMTYAVVGSAYDVIELLKKGCDEIDKN